MWKGRTEPQGSGCLPPFRADGNSPQTPLQPQTDTRHPPQPPFASRILSERVFRGATAVNYKKRLAMAYSVGWVVSHHQRYQDQVSSGSPGEVSCPPHIPNRKCQVAPASSASAGFRARSAKMYQHGRCKETRKHTCLLVCLHALELVSSSSRRTETSPTSDFHRVHVCPTQAQARHKTILVFVVLLYENGVQSPAIMPAFQIISDLHLESGRRYGALKITPTAPYLVLLDDIGLVQQAGCVPTSGQVDSDGVEPRTPCPACLLCQYNMRYKIAALEACRGGVGDDERPWGDQDRVEETQGLVGCALD